MELKELKSLWDEMSKRIEKIEITNKEMIMEITQVKYRNKFKTITKYESFGAVVCYIIALFLMLNFYKLNTWYLMLMGLVAMLFLTIIPYLTLNYLRKLSNLDLANQNYKEVLVEYKKLKNKLLYIQKFGPMASVFMIFISIPIADKILNNEDIFSKGVDTRTILILVFCTLLVVVVAQWGYGWYQKITKSAENLISDLDQDEKVKF